MTRLVQTVAVALSLLWSVGVVSAAQYTFTPLAVPAFGVTQTTPEGVNDQGHVVGTYQQGILVKGFYFDGSAYHDMQVGDCVQVLSYGLNNTGEIVGTCRDTAEAYHGLVLAPDGSFALYDAPGASATNLLCINGPGAMAGSLQAADGIHGVFTDGITWTRIDVPGGTQTQVWGINDGYFPNGIKLSPKQSRNREVF